MTKIHITIMLSLMVTTITAALFFFFKSSYQPDISSPENIHGIPFGKKVLPNPTQNNAARIKPTIIVSEKLAHLDIYLQGSPLAKQAIITLTFSPNKSKYIDIGIRENSFWLSYPWHRVYESQSGQEPPARMTKQIIIPLTDKLTDHDGSLDLMFATDNQENEVSEPRPIDDRTNWQLHYIDIQISPTLPSKSELKNYFKQLISRERPL